MEVIRSLFAKLLSLSVDPIDFPENTGRKFWQGRKASNSKRDGVDVHSSSFVGFRGAIGRSFWVTLEVLTVFQ